MPTEYRLQLLSHGEIFTNREEALTYIEKNFKHESLYAEPALFLYGDKKQPYFILAFGVGDKEITYIDSGDIKESIDNIINGDGQRNEDLATIKDRLMDIVNATGLFYDENKKTHQITYVPDNKDVLLRDAETLAEAVDIISKYVQKYVDETTLNVAETNSAKLTLLENNNGGKVLRAAVKISDNGDSDDEEFNNNIVGIKSDGLYAAAHLEYNENNNQLTFYSSGVKNGRFQDDAKKQVIDLGKHSEVVSDNSDENPIEINVKSDNSTKKISGKLKISEDSSNIIKVQDGALLVDGRAKNIKYKDSTVFSALNSLNTKVDEISSKSELIEKDSDTIDFSITKDANGCTVIGGEVKRSSDNSLKISDGGLSVNLDMKINPADNTLTVKLGDKIEVLTLPSVDFSTLIEKVTYNAANKTIQITFTDGKTVTIPVEDLFKLYTFENDADSPIKLTTEVAPDGSSIVKANIVLKPTDNLVKVENGQLYVSEANIDNKIDVVKTKVETDVKNLSDSMNSEIQTLKETDITLGNGIDSNKEAIKSEASRAELAEQNLSSKIDANTNEISHLVERVTSVEDVNKQQDADINSLKSDNELNKTTIVELKSSVSANETAIANETTRALGEEKKISDITLANQSGLTNLSARVNNVETSLSDRISKTENDIATLNGASTVNGSVREMISVSINGTVMPAIETEKTQREVEDSRLADAIKELQSNVSTGNEATLEAAKSYTDAQVNNAKRDVLVEAATDATTKANTALTDAKTYSDDKLSQAVNRLENADATTNEKVDALKDETDAIKSELSNRVETVTIEKNSASDLQYTLFVDGKPAGEINIPKDQFLKDVTYDHNSRELVFVFTTSEGDKTSTLDISDLVDTYIAGDGLSLTDNVFSVKVAVGSEDYLTVTEDGIMLKGVDNALDLKANVVDVYTKDEADAKFLTEYQDITGLATKDELKNVSDKVTDNENALSILNGNESQDGSVKKALVDAKAYTDTKVGEESDRAKSAEKANADAINILNGNEAVSGSVANAIKVSKDYTDDKVLVEKQERTTVETELRNLIQSKANTSDVYSKTEIDAKGYLTEHQDISGLATKAEVENVDNKIATVDEKVTANKTDITNLTNVVNGMKFHVADSDTISTVLKATETTNELTSNVKIANVESNIIKFNGGGLYANVTFEYNKATNKISFNDGNGVKEFELSNHSLVDDGYYDSDTKSIVLVVIKDGGTTEHVSIPVGDLVNDFKVVDTDNDPIKLHSNTGADGIREISATLAISESKDNGVLNNNGTLFVSKHAKDLIALWENPDGTSTDQSIQGILTSLRVKTDKVDGIESNVAALQSDVNSIKVDTTGLKADLATAKEKIDANTAGIAANKGSIDILNGQMTILNGNVTTLQNSFNELETKVNSYEERVSKLESGLNTTNTAINQLTGDLDELKKQLGTPEEGKDDIYTRLNKIEDVLNNLIDFGNY